MYRLRNLESLLNTLRTISTDHIDILAPQNGIWIFFAFKSYVFVLWVCCFLGLFLSYIFFPTSTTCTTKNYLLSIPFVKKVVLVASYVCLVSRRRQKWYLPAVRMQSKLSCYECIFFHSFR